MGLAGGTGRETRAASGPGDQALCSFRPRAWTQHAARLCMRAGGRGTRGGAVPGRAPGPGERRETEALSPGPVNTRSLRRTARAQELWGTRPRGAETQASLRQRLELGGCSVTRAGGTGQSSGRMAVVGPRPLGLPQGQRGYRSWAGRSGLALVRRGESDHEGFARRNQRPGQDGCSPGPQGPAELGQGPPPTQLPGPESQALLLCPLVEPATRLGSPPGGTALPQALPVPRSPTEAPRHLASTHGAPPY